MLYRNNYKTSLITLLVIISLFIFNPQRFVNGFDASQLSLLELSQEELANLTKPSVVKIVQHVQGKMTVHPFDLDFKNLTIFPIIAEKQPIVLEIDEYFTGSGVIINPDGYILTNSQLVSYQTVKLIKAVQLGAEVYIEKETLLSDEEKNQIIKEKEKLADYGKKIGEYILANSDFELSKTVTVLNPSSQAEKKDDLLAGGFAAKIISVNDNFYQDQKDVAIIKINEAKLPAIKSGNSDSLQVGDTVFVFNFPGITDFNSKNILEPTLTQGIIGAIQDLDGKDFKIIQTDAKDSKDSSGGPLLNDRGELIGLITQTGESEQTAGDNFAFAIPINSVNTMVESGYINQAEGVPIEGEYSRHFRSGMTYLRNRECKKAMSEFDQALNINEKFKNDKNVESYQKQCQSLIEANQSIDTDWQKLIQGIKVTNSFIWIIFGAGSLIFILLILIVWRLSRKINKDKREINMMEKHLDAEEKELGKLEKIVVPVKEESSKNYSKDVTSNNFNKKSKYIEKPLVTNKHLQALDNIKKFEVVDLNEKE